MNNKTYNAETMTAYLLGSLPEEEAEQMDELSFTDDEFADQLLAAENELVDAYVRGELTGAPLERFKAYYLASPIRREKLRFAEGFQAFAENSLAKPIETQTPVGTSDRKQTLFGFISGIFTISRPGLQWGFALAALVFIILGGWLWSENSRLRFQMSDAEAKRESILQREAELQQREKMLQDEIANQRTVNSENEKELAKIGEEREKLAQELKKLQTQPRPNETPPEIPPPVSPERPVIASFILVPQLRGNNQLPNISVPAKTVLVRMRLELEPNDFTAFTVKLQDQSGGQNLWQSGRLKTNNRGETKGLNVVFPARLLKAGIYTLQVSGSKSGGTAEIISDYSFKVMR